MEQLSGSLSGAAIGVYLFSVVWHGNTKQLGDLLKNEMGYIEFIVALMLLEIPNRYGPTSKIAKAITTFALLAIIVRFGAKAGINEKLKDFAVGKASGFDTLKSFFKGK